MLVLTLKDKEKADYGKCLRPSATLFSYCAFHTYISFIYTFR